METLIRSFGIILAFTFCSQLNAQDGNFNKLNLAFESSYELEAEYKYEEAIKVLKAAYKEDSYECNLRLGWLSYLASQLMESKSYYQMAIELKPFAIEPKFGKAYPIYALGNMEELKILYKEILSTAPNNTSALYKLGSVYFYQQSYDEAEKYFSKVVNLFPFDYDGLLMLAHTNFHLKKFREAKVLYHKVLLYNPNDEAALESLKLLD